MTFDPSKHVVKLKGKDYLEVKWRLVWLRQEHPDSEIVTTLLEHDAANGMAVVHAHVRIPGKGAASGLGSETRKDFNDYLEKAETKAIGRALGALGFGTQFTEDFEMDGAVVDSPVERPTPRLPQPVRPTPQQASEAAAPPVVQPGQQATAAERMMSQEQMDALMRLAKAKNVHLGERCVADFGVLAKDLSFAQAGKLITKMSKEVA